MPAILVENLNALLALDAVTPADNPNPGNAFSTAARRGRGNFNLNTHHVFARTALGPGFTRLWARPGSLRNTGRVRRRWCGRLREYR